MANTPPPNKKPYIPPGSAASGAQPPSSPIYVDPRPPLPHPPQKAPAYNIPPPVYGTGNVYIPPGSTPGKEPGPTGKDGSGALPPTQGLPPTVSPQKPPEWMNIGLKWNKEEIQAAGLDPNHVFGGRPAADGSGDIIYKVTDRSYIKGTFVRYDPKSGMLTQAGTWADPFAPNVNGGAGLQLHNNATGVTTTYTSDGRVYNQKDGQHPYLAKPSTDEGGGGSGGPGPVTQPVSPVPLKPGEIPDGIVKDNIKNAYKNPTTGVMTFEMNNGSILNKGPDGNLYVAQGPTIGPKSPGYTTLPLGAVMGGVTQPTSASLTLPLGAVMGGITKPAPAISTLPPGALMGGITKPTSGGSGAKPAAKPKKPGDGSLWTNDPNAKPGKDDPVLTQGSTKEKSRGLAQHMDQEPQDPADLWKIQGGAEYAKGGSKYVDPHITSATIVGGGPYPPDDPRVTQANIDTANKINANIDSALAQDDKGNYTGLDDPSTLLTIGFDPPDGGTKAM